MWLVFGMWVVEADDSFACLTRLSSVGGCGLAETVGLGFYVDSDSASSVSVLDLVCVCVVGVCCLFLKPTNSTVVDRELTPWFLWSVDSGSYNGVSLESVNVTVMICFFSLWKGRSAGRTTSFYLSSRTGWVMHCFQSCGLRTLCGLVDEEHLWGTQQSSRHHFLEDILHW